jgi:hypothetical protein
MPWARRNSRMLAVFASMVAYSDSRSLSAALKLDRPDHDVGRVFVFGQALHRDETLVFLEADGGVAQLVAERR